MSNLDNEAQVVINALVAGLAHNLTEEELPAAQHIPCASVFVETFGKLLDVLTPMDAAKAAAAVQVTQLLQLEKIGEKTSKIMVTLIESMKIVAQTFFDMREAKDKTH